MLLRVNQFTAFHAGLSSPFLPVCFEMDAGSGRVVSGPNGVGKSTFLLGLMGLLGQDGEVSVNGAAVRPDLTARRAAGLRLHPARSQVFPTLTVDAHLQLAGGVGLPPPFDVLGAARGRPAGLLSGGERCLLSLACVLQSPGRIYLLDEPLAALSPDKAQEVALYLRRRCEAGAIVVVVDHQQAFSDWPRTELNPE